MLELETHLNRVIDNLRKRSDVPAWDKILIVEDGDIQHGKVDVIFESSLRTPEAYSSKFQELLDRGYGWMNLANIGIINHTLLLSIEFPRLPSGIPPSQVPINFPGPYDNKDGALCWDSSSKIKIA